MTTALTVREVAELLGTSAALVLQRIHDGHLAAFRLGDGPKSPYRVLPEDLDAFISRRRARLMPTPAALRRSVDNEFRDDTFR